MNACSGVGPEPRRRPQVLAVVPEGQGHDLSCFFYVALLPAKAAEGTSDR